MTEEDDIDGLAGEYVLGSLDAAERRQVDVRLQTDASLAAAIAAWERDLAPLSDQGQGVTPPEHALDGGPRVAKELLTTLELRDRLVESRRVLVELVATPGQELLEALLGSRP